MRRAAFLLLLTVLSIPVSASETAEERQHRYEDFTREITEQLRAESPAAADLFLQANEASDSEQFERAATLYRQVLDLRPDYDHASRRLSQVLARLEQYDESIAAARQALAIADTKFNHSALIAALVADPDAPADHVREAVNESRALLRRPDLEAELVFPTLGAAQQGRDLELLRHGTEYLLRLEPDHPVSHYFAWMVAASDGKWTKAIDEMERAHALGIPDDAYDRMRTTTNEARPITDRYRGVALGVAGSWLAGLVALTLVGAILSWTALRAARQPPADRTGRSSGLGGFLRGAYRTVLWLSCAFYYVSLPLILVAVVAVGGGLVWFFFAVGHIPIKLVLIIIGLVFVTLWALARSLFVRRRDEDPGERLDLTPHPRLRAILDEVAERIGTRPVDNVYMTPGTDLAVMERGGLGRQLSGRTERCLILGTGVLDGLRKGPFKAILAHEYGHFSNRDTAGGGFALAVRRSIRAMAIGLVQGGAAGWYNPAWIFIQAFQRVFLRISQGASRLQEVLADRWAAFAYGASMFEAGLLHVIRRSLEFDVTTNRLLKGAIEQGQPLHSLYTARERATGGDDVAELEKAVEAAVGAKPSPYDSHPSPKDRFTLVHALDARPEGDLSDADEDVWALFDDRAAIEARMTDHVIRNVEQAYGVSIARA